MRMRTRKVLTVSKEVTPGIKLPCTIGRDDEAGLFHKGPGTWRWRMDHPFWGPRSLEVVCPKRTAPEGSPHVVTEWMIAVCPVCKETHFDEHWGWDGNIDKPTLIGSILVESYYLDQHYEWHGWMREGDLVPV